MDGLIDAEIRNINSIPFTTQWSENEWLLIKNKTKI